MQSSFEYKLLNSTDSSFDEFISRYPPLLTQMKIFPKALLITSFVILITSCEKNGQQGPDSAAKGSTGDSQREERTLQR